MSADGGGNSDGDGDGDSSPQRRPRVPLLQAAGKAVVAANRMKRAGALRPRWEGVLEKKGNKSRTIMARWKERFVRIDGTNFDYYEDKSLSKHLGTGE